MVCVLCFVSQSSSADHRTVFITSSGLGGITPTVVDIISMSCSFILHLLPHRICTTPGRISSALSSRCLLTALLKKRPPCWINSLLVIKNRLFKVNLEFVLQELFTVGHHVQCSRLFYVTGRLSLPPLLPSWTCSPQWLFI